MAAHSTTTLRNGHTLTIVGVSSTEYRVEERNGLGSFLHIAYVDRTLAPCEAWIDRAVGRGYGLHKGIGIDDVTYRAIPYRSGSRCVVVREHVYTAGSEVVFGPDSPAACDGFIAQIAQRADDDQRARDENDEQRDYAEERHNAELLREQ